MTQAVTEPVAGAAEPGAAEPGTADPGAAGSGAAAALAPMVEVWFRILEDHVPDVHGRCSACTSAGTGVRRTPWPCSINTVAEQARQWHAACAVPVPRAAGDGVRRTARRLGSSRGISRPLTPREQDYLQLAADGCSDTEIAERLDVPERTVGASLRRIGHALGVPARTDLLVLAFREGVVV